MATACQSQPELGALGMSAGPHSTRITPESCNVIMVDKFIHEVFQCVVCDQRFATQAASERIYSRCTWVATRNTRDNKKSINTNVVDWQNMRTRGYHGANTVYTSSVTGLLYSITSTPGAVRNIELLSKPKTFPNTPLAERDEIFRAAQGSWQEVSHHPTVRSHFNHCPECHLCCARPQYVRRHMRKKHHALVSVISAVEQQIRDSNIGVRG